MQRHEEMESLVAGYALSALEPDEAAAFAEHVKSCSGCAELLIEMRALVGAMPLTVPQVSPPPDLKARLREAVLVEAGGARPSPAVNQGPSVARRKRLPFPSMVAAAAVLSLVALVGTAAWAFTLQGRLDTSQARISSLYDAMTVLAEADQRWEFSGTTIESTAHGILAYSSDHEAALLMVWGLPPADEETAYVAWSASGDERQGAGTMGRANDGMWAVVYGNIANVDSVGISLRDSSATSGGLPNDVVVISLTQRER